MASIDFQTIKDSLKTYLASQQIFKDYDFEGSNINVLLDILSYNTMKNSFYLNMVGNEMFLDSAQLRDSAVSKAKELNYLPRSYRSASMSIRVKVPVTDETKATLTLPKGSSFIGKVGPETYQFTTQENILIPRIDSLYQADIEVFEGIYLSQTYLQDPNNPQAYVIDNPRVDTRSIAVTVIEDDNATFHSYLRADSLFGLNNLSKNYFLQGYRDGKYEILFGDNVIGRKPKDYATILIEYRSSNGELPNGLNNIRAAGSIDGQGNVTVEVLSSATGGAVAEDLEGIRFSAPRHFTTQERAVVAGDYENLLKINYPEINVVAAFGGEEADPPQFGKVIVSVDLNDADGLPLSKEREYKAFLKSRNPLSIEPIFVDPEYLYGQVISKVNYNINTTALSAEDIKAQVVSSILDYNSTYLNDFKSTLRYSQILTAIDSSHPSILSNETEILLLKKLKIQTAQTVDYRVQFNQPLSSLPNTDRVTTNIFTYQNQKCLIKDVNGILNLYINKNNQLTILRPIGSVDYGTGEVSIKNLKIDSTGTLKISVKTESKDIISSKNDILSIIEDDMLITVAQVRE